MNRNVDKKDRQKRKKIKILIFSGTTEGNQIAKELCKFPVKVYVSVATEYGKVCAQGQSEAEIITGRMDCEAIQAFVEKHQINIVIDATHPFARVVTENVRKVCDDTQTKYIRCVREAEKLENVEHENEVWVENIEQAIKYLQQTKGNILVTTGGKELHKYSEIKNYQDRCYARVLSTEKSIKDAVKSGFEGKHLIAMQGPFSTEMNIALIHYTKAAYLVTKESGKAGGFEEKQEAAKCTGTKLVIVQRPIESGWSVAQTIDAVVRSLDDKIEKSE